MSGDVIVVTGTRDNHRVFYTYDPSSLRWYQYEVHVDGHVEFIESGDTAPVADDPNDSSDTVKIVVSNSSNMEGALKAAANILATIEAIKSQLSSLDPNKSIYVGDKMTTVGAELQRLNRTKFEITDQPSNNGGDGSANYSTQTISFHFASFDGNLSNSEGRDYADPAYVNMAGLIGIVAHELGHLTDNGNRMDIDNRFYAAKASNENLGPSEFNEHNPFWKNREAWAHDYAKDYADAIGLNVDQWKPREGTDWKLPRLLYDTLYNAGSGGSSHSNHVELEDTMPSTDTGYSISFDYQIY